MSFPISKNPYNRFLSFDGDFSCLMDMYHKNGIPDEVNSFYENNEDLFIIQELRYSIPVKELSFTSSKQIPIGVYYGVTKDMFFYTDVITSIRKTPLNKVLIDDFINFLSNNLDGFDKYDFILKLEKLKENLS